MTYKDFLKRFVTVLGGVVLTFGAWHLRSILLIGFLSSVIAVSLSIPVAKLRQYGMPRGYAILVTVVGGILGLILFLTAILPGVGFANWQPY